MIRQFLCAASAALLILSGCTDQPLIPEAMDAPPAAALSSTSTIALDNVLEFVEVPDLSTARHAEKWIHADEGGFVELHGFRVDIPAGALPQDTLVTIDLPEDPVLGKRVLAEFGPHDVQFAEPVTLSFPLDGVLLLGEEMEVSRWENDAWAALGGTVSADGSRLIGFTPRFSTYGGTWVMAGG